MENSMRQPVNKGVLMATSAGQPRTSKRKRPRKTTAREDHSNAVSTAQPHDAHRQRAGVKKTTLSKKAIKKLLDKKIAYRPFKLFKETMGVEGNYGKLIYNTPKY
jgi:hypothetical protein